MTTLPSGPILHFNTTTQRLALDTSVLSEGQLSYVQDADKHYRWDGSTWDEFGVPGAGVPDSIVFAQTGTVAIVTGATRWYNDTGAALTLLSVRASVGTAPTGADLIVDLNLNGTTVWSTQANRATIAAGANTGESATFNTSSVPDGSYLTADVDQVGSGTPGSDLTVTVWMS